MKDFSYYIFDTVDSGQVKARSPAEAFTCFRNVVYGVSRIFVESILVDKKLTINYQPTTYNETSKSFLSKVDGRKLKVRNEN